MRAAGASSIERRLPLKASAARRGAPAAPAMHEQQSVQCQHQSRTPARHRRTTTCHHEARSIANGPIEIEQSPAFSTQGPGSIEAPQCADRRPTGERQRLARRLGLIYAYPLGPQHDALSLEPPRRHQNLEQTVGPLGGSQKVPKFTLRQLPPCCNLYRPECATRRAPRCRSPCGTRMGLAPAHQRSDRTACSCRPRRAA